MANILYISLTGMTEPLGESQVVQYLLDLAKLNKIFLFSFEKNPHKEKLTAMQQRLAEANIQWKFAPYSNRFRIFSTLWQMIIALSALSYWIKTAKIQIVHARSFVPAVMGLILKKRFGVKLLFDMRGFAIAEKIIEGRLKEKAVLTYLLKKLEKIIYQKADHVVTLTYASTAVLENCYQVQPKKISVIPTCVNPEIFKRLSPANTLLERKKMGFGEQDLIFLHHGSINEWVDFRTEVLLFREASRLYQQARFLILNQGQQDLIQNILVEHEIPAMLYKIKGVPFQEVFRYLNIADLSLFFIKPSFAKQASAPTKFAENVACHLFSVTSDGYGDMAFYFNLYPVGLTVNLDELKRNPQEAAKKILQLFPKEKRPADYDNLLKNYFAKKIAIEKYQKIYDALGGHALGGQA